MKNITKQYQDLLEGKMSKANFMVNVRREFPQWISPVNTFTDAVNILKSKRILSEANAGGDRGHIGGETRQTEGHEGNTQWLEAFKDDIDNRIASLSSDEKTKVEKAMEYLGDDGLVEYYGSFLLPWAANAFMSDVEEINKKADEEEDAMIKSAGMSTMHTRRSMSPGSDPEAFEPLNEAVEGRYKEATGKAEYDKFAEMDRVDYRQLTKGTEFELLKMPEITDENYIKAKTKAYKNLIKNPKYYMHLLVAGADKVEKKDKDLRMQPVKKDNMTDKANAMKVIKKDEGSNTQDSLGKKERAKGNPEGVKMLKEEMMNEFGTAIPEPKLEITKGHQVKTPDGRVGIVNEKDQGGTLTIEFEDGSIEDFQQNVVKPADEKPLTPPTEFHLGAGRSDYAKKMQDKLAAEKKARLAKKQYEGSAEELKEKLMKSLKKDVDEVAKVTDETGAIVKLATSTGDAQKFVASQAPGVKSKLKVTP